MTSLRFVVLLILAGMFSSCSTIHQFIGPSPDWQARNGQMN